LFPAFIFVHNKKGGSNLVRSSIIDKLEGEISEDTFRDALIKNIDIRERKVSEDSSHSIDLIEQQKKELAQLERLEDDKRRQLYEEKKKVEAEVFYVDNK
jgi:hypothetical protein